MDCAAEMSCVPRSLKQAMWIRIDMREDDDCGVLWAHAHHVVTHMKQSKKVIGMSSVEQMVNVHSVLLLTISVENPEWLHRMAASVGAVKLKQSSQRKCRTCHFHRRRYREDGREREYFRFEGEGGQGGRGRRQKAAPGCRLFVGGSSRCRRG